MLWIALAVMTGLAMGFALFPLAYRRRTTPGPAREAAFYRAQLAEIERDVERGLLPPEEAASARTETARRLLAVGDAPARAEPGPWRSRAAAVVILLLVPAIALPIYLNLGKPEMPDAPLETRKAAPNAPDAVQAAVAKVEAHLMQHPEDRRGWEVLAPVYMRMGDFVDGAGAYRQVIRLGLDTPEIRAHYGEALVAIANGVVTADARAEFQKATDLPMAKFYLALAAEQDGKKVEATAAYKALEPAARGKEPWMLGLRARLEAPVTGEPAKPAETTAGADASPQGFSPEQQKMIETMVQSLASRLKEKGGSAEEWGRLIRAYSVLHQQEMAREALASARKALGPNADIDALARELGLEG